MIGKYSVIYADPPWRYAQKGLQGRRKNTTPQWGLTSYARFPVADLAAPDSVLFLWATFPQLPEALRLIKAWGFTYKSVALDRPALQKVTEAVVAGRVDVVLVHSLTRVGREWGMTQSYIDLLTRHKVKLLCIRERLLFDENGAKPF